MDHSPTQLTPPAFQCRVVRRAFFSAAVEDHNHEISGHNYILEAYVEGPIDPESGMILSIRKFDEILTATTKKLDHKFLNKDLPEFSQRLPSAEHLAQFCFSDVLKNLTTWAPHLNLHKVRLYETDELWVDYGPHIVPEI